MRVYFPIIFVRF